MPKARNAREKISLPIRVYNSTNILDFQPFLGLFVIFFFILVHDLFKTLILCGFSGLANFREKGKEAPIL